MTFNNHHIVHAIHILLSGPLLIYVGYLKPTYKWIYQLLLALGIIMVIAFSIKLILKRPWTQKHVWYILHGALFATLLIYVGWRGPEKTENVTYSIMLAVGIAAFGYHLLRISTSHAT